MRETLRLLKQYLEQGYCLHGSQRRSEMLEPRIAKCESGRVAGCQKAVYASKDCVRVPCLMAMFAPIDPANSRECSYTGAPDGKLIVTGTNVTFKPGYVHVLPAATFQELDDEFISYECITPVAILLVTPEILELLPDMELHMPS